MMGESLPPWSPEWQADFRGPNNSRDYAAAAAGAKAAWALTLPPIAQGSQPDLYLRSRGLGFDRYPPDLRMTKDGQHMIALIRAPGGEVTSFQRTVLERKDGKWIKERKMMKNPPMHTIPPGSSIRLGKVLNGRMGCAEGVESALSSFKRSGNVIATWATITAIGMSTWMPPAGVKSLFIFHDSGLTGERAANRLRFTCNNHGVTPLLVAPEMLVSNSGNVMVADANDILKNDIRRHIAHGRDR